MLLVDRKIKGLPITFLIVSVVTVLVTIFFGAWAVSADAQTGNANFGALTGAPNLGSANDGASTQNGEGASGGQENESAADAWYGKALLKACPFH